MSHPYLRYEGTALWEAVDEVLADLEANRDLSLTTARQYAIGLLCQRLSVAHLTTLAALREAATGSTSRFADRFQRAQYGGSEPVAVSWSGRRQDVPLSLFARAQCLARAYDLHLLPALEPYGTTQLTSQQAATLAEELEFVGDLVDDRVLRPYIDGLISVALECSWDPGKVDLIIEGP